MRVVLLVLLILCVKVQAADPHSFSNFALVSHPELTLDLTADFNKQQLHGFVELQLQWHHPDIRELILDSRDLSIEKVMGQSAEGKWLQLSHSLGETSPTHGQALRIEFPAQFPKVRIYYHTSPQASGLQWLTKEQTSEKKQPFMYSQSQSVHARSWIPLQDTPAVRLTYQARIRAPKQLLAVMGADNSANSDKDGDYFFRMPQAIPAYLIALAIGDLEFKAMSERTGVYAEKVWLDKAVAEFSDTEQMMQVASVMYGDYPWGRYDLLILPASFPFGGMENPRLSFITPTVIAGDKSLVSLIAHELAHSWSGNLVTNDSWHELWLNEGFTNYVENRIMEQVFGPERALLERQLSVQDLENDLLQLDAKDTLLITDYTGRDPDEAFTQVPYVKGMLFLQFLEQRFGRAVFDPFLKNYFQSFAFQSMDTEKFLRYLRKTLLNDPDIASMGEILEWLYQPGLASTFVAPASDAFKQVDQQLAVWQKTGNLTELQTNSWSIHHWLHFIGQLAATVDLAQLKQLDQAFHLSQSQNAEVATAWFKVALAKNYQPALPALEQFLMQVGRRKFVVPLYQQLSQQPEHLERAKNLYQKARPGYHPLTQSAVDKVLKLN
ncbi:MAG: M1 family metallopeptidase [Gammaproteobacteria bacterium]|nr:M1 family metallopeptidase [Gammaproteobacteria bacterium]MBU2057930.1 M1 family metallopeptidase [Gammaproteobacteria bacterium]MBU2174282.1 M1 family metallopeptidase [Gammaproteobacteria bacterium]MBU2247768.1 M1 family metallopeptidase [Gammaproteobacteria bacterium]MBU2344293.1 M1 family metallopeptidase [Gammaproteobacteria bacterium]